LDYRLDVRECYISNQTGGVERTRAMFSTLRNRVEFTTLFFSS
jgi:hypothetical protein